VHVNGEIIDSAFTMSLSPKYDSLIKTVKMATYQGIKSAGIDARFGEIGADIEEVMRSGELVLGNKTYKIKPVCNLSGHTIGKYKVHADKSLPIVATDDQTKMEEGEHYAIETFGTIGKGLVNEQGECSHYMLDDKAEMKKSKVEKNASILLSVIKKRFGTLAWCRRYLDEAGETKYLSALCKLVKMGVVDAYPPLCDTSYVAQFEHTLIIKASGKDILSLSNDY
jgi:methionyl aminopeptidase